MTGMLRNMSPLSNTNSPGEIFSVRWTATLATYVAEFIVVSTSTVALVRSLGS